MQEREEERKDSSGGIWLVLIWKYCFTSSELNYLSELAVLREQAERHRQPRWARSGRRNCHHDHSEHVDPWSVDFCSSFFFIYDWSKVSFLFLLGSDLTHGVADLEEYPEVSLYLSLMCCAYALLRDQDRRLTFNVKYKLMKTLIHLVYCLWTNVILLCWRRKFSCSVW